MIYNSSSIQDIYIPSTESTPSITIDFAKKQIDIVGESRPENVKAFYEPILDLIKDFESYLLNQVKQYHTEITLQVKFRLNYFNSSSAKYILILIQTFQSIEDNSNHAIKIVLNWHYELDDDDNLHAGQEMARLTKTNLHFIAY